VVAYYQGLFCDTDKKPWFWTRKCQKKTTIYESNKTVHFVRQFKYQLNNLAKSYLFIGTVKNITDHMKC
jgi:hypothetical protein